MTRILAIANQKGGVAKTTTVESLGAALADLDVSVLVVDLDPQGCLTFSLGHDPDQLTSSVHDVLLGDEEIADVLLDTEDKVTLLPATIDLAGAEALLLMRAGREYALKRALDKVADDFDVVVIDEFHHAAASTYTNLLSRVEPRELLGLTATPERSDSLDILHWFGGRATYELRLWDALEQDLLCPFHYFGIADNTDLRGITWSRGDYNQSDLENVYTGNDARTRLILNAVRERVVSPRTMRALGFCVSIAHAEYMAREFTRQGVPSVALSAGTSSPERADAFRRLRHGEGACLFAVDIFNEGIDIPSLNQVVMMRQTQSRIIFTQQLGRGLRLAVFIDGCFWHGCPEHGGGNTPDAERPGQRPP